MPELQHVLDKAPHASGRYVPTEDGKPYSKLGNLSRAFKKWARRAGLPKECTAHGVRKAASAIVWETTGSEAALCSIFGWAIGSPMAKDYPKKYDKRRAATAGLAGLRSVA